MIINLSKEDKAMQIVCMAIGEQADLIDNMEVIEAEDCLRDIKFTVGGVELDFLNVVKAINEYYDKDVEEKAKELISNKVGDIYRLLDNVEDKLKDELSMNKDNE